MAPQGRPLRVRRGIRRLSLLDPSEIRLVLSEPADGLISATDYRSDLQMHSTWSDGRQPIALLAAACIRRRYTHCAITDHSAGLKVAHGVSMARFAEQHLEIDAINAECARRFTVLKGVEANIRADGTLDVPTDDLARFDVVLAAPHSSLRGHADQTARLVRAVSVPGVHVLAHPRGRKIGVRDGIRANWDRVFAEAARRHVAVEIDGDPRRQDLDFELAKRALDQGCLLAVDSDAHHPDELAFAEVGLAHARLAGATHDRVINCWPIARLRRWLRSRP